MKNCEHTAQTPTDEADVTQRTMRGHDAPAPSRLLADLRAGGTSAQRARSIVAFRLDNPSANVLRAAVARLLVANIQPGDHALVRWLLEQETQQQRAIGSSSSETLYAIVAALARFAQPDDALLIWRAREANDQTRSGVDVEQLGRLGADVVRRYLRTVIGAGGAEAGEAGEALAWLEEGLISGAFADLPGYFAWADERFGLHVSGPV